MKPISQFQPNNFFTLIFQTYEIPIIATDGGGRSGFTTVKVKVGDENDNPPVFQLREYKSVIHGNLTVNTIFLKVIFLIKIISKRCNLKFSHFHHNFN